MSRRFNFCAGPAALPEAVLQQAQAEMLDWQGRGLSIMEMSHRSKEYVAIAEQAERDLRDLLNIPDDYAVLFLQGGASQQISMLAMNLLREGESADYVNTGVWSTKALEEAKRFGTINEIASSADRKFCYVPRQEIWQPTKEAVYLHYTPNETIGGVEFSFIPQTDKPLVADFSSTILSRPLDVSKFGLIYAGAQKNIGPAGIVVVIIRKDLLGRVKNLPAMLDYKVHADNGSMYNTPPTYSWYLAGLVFQWLKQQGGLEAMAEINARKADKLYRYIDGSDFYSNPVDVVDRSWMNVPFVLRDASLDKRFLAESDAAGLLNLAGHRSVGGMRASLYNAVSEQAVDALIEFMNDFAKTHA